ncbi:MAG: hypothetical protein H6873_11460 [Hyphomicrobiaceae bacterium]|nr:hypothetical protein [Hyphomicrobiaceae bacterium]
MADDHIRYDILTQDALRGVVRKVLSEVEKTGLPAEHHFFISFMTHAPGVRMSERLLAKYPNEMTIVLQNQFWNLSVSESAFSVGLSFDGINETLIIPFTAMKGFFDPSVQFGLQFDTKASSAAAPVEAGDEEVEANVADAASAAPDKSASQAEKPAATEAEKVISLDAFRKKP